MNSSTISNSNNNNNNNNNTSTNWHRTSNERCASCNNLLTICRCSFRLNTSSARIRQNLDDLESKTEFARTAFQRKLAEFHNECQQSAQDIQRSYAFGVSRFTNYLEILHELNDCFNSQTMSRHRLEEQQGREYCYFKNKFMCGAWCARVVASERNRREEILHEERRTHSLAILGAEYEYQLVALVQRQAVARAYIENEECVSYDPFFAINERLRNRAYAFVEEQDALEETHFKVANELRLEASAVLRALHQAMIERSNALIFHHNARVECLEEYHSSLRQFEIYEERERSFLRSTFTDELYELESLLAAQEQERKCFFNDETVARAHVRSAEVARIHAVLDFHQQHREDVLAGIAHREAERSLLLSEASLTLRHIAEEQDEDRENIYVLLEHGKVEVRHVISDKKTARERVWSEVLRFRNIIDLEEDNERIHLSQQMSDRTTLIELREEILGEHINAIVAAEADSRMHVANQREADLTNFALTMEDGEGVIRSRTAARRAERYNTESLEAHFRQKLLQMEDKNFEFINEENWRLLEQILCNEDRQQQERDTLLQDARAELHLISMEEETEREALFVVRFNAEANVAVDDEFDRYFASLLDAERRFRNKGTLQETTERHQIGNLLQHQIREVLRKEEAELEIYIDMLIAEESADRDEYSSAWFDGVVQMEEWNGRRLQQLRILEQDRLEAEKQEEEAKKYDLMMMMNNNNINNGEENENNNHNNHYYRRGGLSISQNQNNSNNNNSRKSVSSSQNHPFLPEGCDIRGSRMSLADVRRSVSIAPTSDRKLKIDYIGFTLRLPQEQIENFHRTLSDAQVNLFSAMIEQSAMRRRQHETNAAESENKLRAIEAKLLEAQGKLESRNSSAEFYRTKIAEEQARHEQTIMRAKDLTQQAKKQAKIEEQRVGQAAEYLKNLKNEIENLKDACHQKLGGRK